MTKNTVDIREVYALITELRKENQENSQKMVDMFDSFQKEKFTPLKERVDKLWTYGGVLIFMLSVAGSIAVDWVKKNVLHI